MGDKKAGGGVLYVLGDRIGIKQEILESCGRENIYLFSRHGHQDFWYGLVGDRARTQ